MKEDKFLQLDKQISQTPLYGLLGAKGIEELRSKIVELIVDQVRDDLEHSSYYIIDPDDINETLNENIIEEALADIKAEYKEKVKKYMSVQLEKLLNGMD